LDMVSHPGFRSRLLFWEGWRDPQTVTRGNP
jgi:hypothetical protein